MKAPPLKTLTFFVLLPFAVLGCYYVYSHRVSTIRAFGNLSVDFGVPAGQPIFTNDDFKPGHCAEHTITVTNNSDSESLVAIRSSNESETKQLAQALLITISTPSDTLYQSTLHQFYLDSQSPDGVVLSPLLPDQSIPYNISVCFDPTAGNEYQAGSTKFDLIFGEVLENSTPLPPECASLQGEITTTLIGKPGKHILIGTKTSELILADPDNTIIKGRGGSDCIVAASPSKIYGGSGADIIIGSSGRDQIKGSTGRDTLYGMGGNDRLWGGTGSDYLDGGPGYDYLHGQSNRDTCVSGERLYSCEL